MYVKSIGQINLSMELICSEFKDERDGQDGK